MKFTWKKMMSERKDEGTISEIAGGNQREKERQIRTRKGRTGELGREKKKNKSQRERGNRKERLERG